MRIEPHEQTAILSIARDVFGPGSRVRLFGSRLDDSARGGDIDLLIEVDGPLPNRVLLAAEMEARLMLALGEQKIDVLVKDEASPRSPVVEHASATGKLLQWPT